MNRTDRHAQALDACLEQIERHGLSAEAALDACSLTVEPPAELAELIGLATGLRQLPPAPGPAPDFVAQLAEALRLAPPPACLAPSEADIAALEARLVEVAAAARAADAPILATATEATLDAMATDTAAESAQLPGLSQLAAALAGLPKAENPSDAFVGRLARTLASAPPPAGMAGEPMAEALAAGETTVSVVHALETGLEALRQEGLGAAIETQDPRLAGELAPLLALAGALRDMPAPPRPGDRFRDQLAEQLANAPEPSALARRRAERASMGFLHRLWRSTAFAAAAAATVILFMAAGVTYASANALPGDLLYPVKRAAESARLWLASDDAQVNLHLGLADRRLAEALAVPATAGQRLAEFNREVTEALVVADATMSAGLPRERVAAPLLTWLTGARGRLIDGRPLLPPMAWRASLALIDEAILALQSGQPLSSAPVPRLFSLSDRLLLASAGPRDLGLRERPVARPLPVQPVALAASARAAAPRPAPIQAQPGAPPGARDPEPAPPDRSDRPRQPSNDPAPAGPSPVEHASNPAPPTLPALILPTPTAAPTRTALPTPTAEPTASPTALPSPTLLPASPPEIVEIGCTPRKIFEAGEAGCSVEARDPDAPDGAGLTYRWWVLPTQGIMLKSDQPIATYVASFNGSGLGGKETVIISVEITDADGLTVIGETTVEVLPSGQQQGARH